MEVLKGKLTGNMTDNGYVYVKLATGIEIPCLPTFAFPIIFRPNKNWINKYKDNFYAIVTTEENNDERHLLIGLVPLVTKEFPENTLDGSHYILTEKFQVWIDDKENKFIVKPLEDGEILLGDENVTEPLVLGNKMESLWKELISVLEGMTFTNSAGTTLVSNNITAISALKEKFNTTLSKKNKTK